MNTALTTRLLPTLMACAATLPLGACASPSQDSSSPEASAPDTPATGQSPQPANEASPNDATTPAPTSTDAAGASSEATPRCTADSLQTTVEQGDSAAGELGYTISFTNTSYQACSLDGHPGVSAVGDHDGSQIGASATREGESEKSVVLIPNGHATATVQAVNIGDNGGPLGDSCDPVPADGWRIYPPGSKKSVYVEQDGLMACASDDVDWLKVSVVEPVS